ncbi:MAG: hypothetical protein ABR502_00240 [Chitinophagaceae bacterium]
MGNKLKTYEDLLAEQQRLTSILRNQEEQIKVDIAGVKENFQQTTSKVTKFSTRDKVASPVMMFGLDMVIDYLFRRILFARAGFLFKAVIPYLIKNYSSHIIGDKIRLALRNKLGNIFSKIRPKTQAFPSGGKEGTE